MATGQCQEHREQAQWPSAGLTPRERSQRCCGGQLLPPPVPAPVAPLCLTAVTTNDLHSHLFPRFPTST